MTIKLESKNLKSVEIEKLQLIAKGWKVITEPYQNFFGNWICKLEKTK